MTTISATSMSSYYAAIAAAAAKTSTKLASTGAETGSDLATSITLSDAAKAALNQKDFAAVIAETRKALDDLLAGGKAPADVSLSSLDRRQLFAVATNTDGTFTADERAAAKSEALRRRDAALAGPLAVARVTDDIESIYTAALDFLDGASTEEKSTAIWVSQRDALLEARKQLAADPSKTPNVDGDLVADYIRRATAGETGATRAFADVATDARAALDSQLAAATAAGVRLVFSKGSTTGRMVDFSKFDNRSLSAVALNEGKRFSAEEVLAAKTEVRSRSNATLLAGLNSASGDATAFAKNLLGAYASMSPEERSAAGWSDKLYAAAVSSYRTAAQLTNILGNSSGGGSSAASLLNSGIGGASATGAGTGTGMSLADYLGSTG